MDDNEKGLPVEPKTDGQVVSGPDEFSSDGAVEHYIDPAAEKRLIVKLDLYLAPVMTLIFLAAYLDRANIGNAASAGMTADLHMTSGQLGNAVTLFYVLYVAFEVPCTIVVKKLHPGRMIPALMFCWSIVIIGTGFMHTANQLYASRLLLGLFESGMFPCLAVYLSTFYKREEQGLRIAYLLVSAALSGAFGGLFAFALLKMDGVGGLAGWRWLFIVEGLATVVISLAIFFLLPDNFETARFLNEEDRKIMRIRAEIAARYNGKEEFEWEEIRKAFQDPKTWISCWSQFMGDICSFGLSTFLPLIIKGFGYTTVRTQLLTIPVFLVAAFFFVIVSWFSDHFGKRVFFMLPAVLVTMIGYALQLGIPISNKAVLYFSTFLIAPGIYIILGLNCTWLLNCHAGYYKRATAVGMNQTIGNAAGVVVGQIFKKTVNGKYLTGLRISLGAVLLAGCGHIALYTLLRYQNMKRERMSLEEKEEEIKNGWGGDFHPDFRYAL
ncbi:major facilitator superfamily domain-containing protein [Hyaloscypha finlandica]|nr:major facilitator superfamily domain-containing protein [Hyaloscypha finlandica]